MQWWQVQTHHEQLRESLLWGKYTVLLESLHEGGLSASLSLVASTIHHVLYGRGGERCLVISKNKEILVDEYNPETSTVCQFYGCKWHGCPCLGYANDKYRDTLSMENQIGSLGHDVVSIWECENLELTRTHLQKEFAPYLYPHCVRF